jgi:hypothetical protein
MSLHALTWRRPAEGRKKVWSTACARRESEKLLHQVEDIYHILTIPSSSQQVSFRGYGRTIWTILLKKQCIDHCKQCISSRNNDKHRLCNLSFKEASRQMALAYGLVVTVAFTNRAAVPFWSNTEHLRFVQIKKINFHQIYLG